MPRGSAVAALLLAAMAMPGAKAQEAPIAFAQAGRPDTAAAVARMVRGILDYSHWPIAPAPIRVCLAGAPALGGRIAGTAGLAVRGPAAPATIRAGDCDAVYLGAMAPADRATLLARLRGNPVVTIDEADPACRAGAMFCIRAAGGSLDFDLNLDAVSRSTVRIDPRVLRLSWSGGSA